MSPLSTALLIVGFILFVGILIGLVVGSVDPSLIPADPTPKYTALDRDIDEALRMVQPNPLLKCNPNVNYVPAEWSKDGAL